MKVNASSLILFVVTFFITNSYKYPFSPYVKTAVLFLFLAYTILTCLLNVLPKARLYAVLVGLFCAWCTLSYFWADYPQGINEQLLNTYLASISNVAMALYISQQKQSIDEIAQWLLPIMLVICIQSFLIGKWDYNMRYSPNGAANQFGIEMSYVFFIALYLLRTRAKKPPITYIVALLSFILSIMTGSRKVLLNLVISICVVFLFREFDRHILKIIGKVMAVCLCAAVAIFLVLNIDSLYRVVGYRIVSLVDYMNGNVRQDLSALRRAYMKQDATELFLKSPILGIGLNNFKYIARYGTYAHSNYYEMLCNLGIVGAILYYCPFAVVLVSAFNQWKKNVKDAAVPLCIMGLFVINEFSNVSYIYGYLQYLLGIAAAIVFVNDRNRRNESNIMRKSRAQATSYFLKQT